MLVTTVDKQTAKHIKPDNVFDTIGETPNKPLETENEQQLSHVKLAKHENAITTYTNNTDIIKSKETIEHVPNKRKINFEDSSTKSHTVNFDENFKPETFSISSSNIPRTFTNNLTAIIFKWNPELHIEFNYRIGLIHTQKYSYITITFINTIILNEVKILENVFTNVILLLKYFNKLPVQNNPIIKKRKAIYFYILNKNIFMTLRLATFTFTKDHITIDMKLNYIFANNIYFNGTICKQTHINNIVIDRFIRNIESYGDYKESKALSLVPNEKDVLMFVYNNMIESVSDPASMADKNLFENITSVPEIDINNDTNTHSTLSNPNNNNNEDDCNEYPISNLDTQSNNDNDKYSENGDEGSKINKNENVIPEKGLIEYNAEREYNDSEKNKYKEHVDNGKENSNIDIADEYIIKDQKHENNLTYPTRKECKVGKNSENLITSDVEGVRYESENISYGENSNGTNGMLIDSEETFNPMYKNDNNFVRKKNFSIDYSTEITSYKLWEQLSIGIIVGISVVIVLYVIKGNLSGPNLVQRQTYTHTKESTVFF